MKIEFKSGDKKVSIEGKLEDFILKGYPFNYLFPLADFNFYNENIFSKFDPAAFNKLYKKAPQNILDYYKDTYKAFDRYVKSRQANNENVASKPGNLPANGHDIYNYVVRYGIANCHLQAILKLNGQLDFEKLSKAVRLSVDAEPVLGCRFVENEPPFWKRLKDIDKVSFCILEETNNVNKAVLDFLESPLDMEKDPAIKIKLVRSSQYDTLCMKVNHACTDGTGTKEYIQLLSDIYSRINHEDDDFMPEPVGRSRKDQDRLFAELGIGKPEAAWIPGSEITKATWPFPWKQSQSDITRFVIRRLQPGLLDDMKDYAKMRGATINDLLLTAYYRAMAKMGRPVYTEPMEIPVTVDLRRYLPDKKTEGIRNFSGSATTSLTLAEFESFNKTLSRVVRTMREIKNGHPGLQSAIGLERLEKMPWLETLAYFKMIAQWPNYCCDKCAPVLSNLGIISKSPVIFGDITVTDAYIVPPVVRSPGLLLMTSTYNDVLTLTAGYYETSVSHENIERLLNNIKDELTDGCSQYKKYRE